MKWLVISLVLLLAACGKADTPSEPLIRIIPKTTDKGYKKYISTCVKDIDDEKICICQADLLKRHITDEEFSVIADAGTAAARGDIATTNRIMTGRTELTRVVKSVAFRAKSCASNN